MKCLTCGHDNLEVAQFCRECGASLSTSKPIGVGAASSEPPTGSFPKTIKRNHHRRIKPWMWIVSGCVGLPLILFVGIVIVFGLMFSGALGCPAFLGCEDWGQVPRGDSYSEEGLNRRLTVHEGDCPVKILDDFKKAIEVTPLILEGEMSRDVECQAWSFNGDEGQILQFEPRPKSGNHIDFEHVAIHLSLVDDERLQTADPEVIGKDEELREIALPETGTYTLQVEGNSDDIGS